MQIEIEVASKTELQIHVFSTKIGQQALEKRGFGGTVFCVVLLLSRVKIPVRTNMRYVRNLKLFQVPIAVQVRSRIIDNNALLTTNILKPS